MSNERRSETPVSDSGLRREISLSVILQGLILAAIVGSVTVLLDIKDTLAELYAVQRVANTEISMLKGEMVGVKGRLRDLEMGGRRPGP